MNVTAFFDLLVQHLKSRKDTVRFLCSAVAPELWLSCEASALLDTNREKCGLPNEAKLPKWWVAPEHRKIDLWVAHYPNGNGPYDEGFAFEFKVVHNNKNFRTKVREIRKDLGPLKQPGDVAPARFAIAFCIYKIYTRGFAGNYRYLHNREKEKQVASEEEFFRHLADRLATPDEFQHKKLPAASVIQRERICDLAGARYTDSGSCSLALIHPG